jgi:predicted permease
MLQDIRFALRYWRKHPAFAATAIGLMALAIAANSVIFSVADTLLLKPLPVRDPDALVRILEIRKNLPPDTWFVPGFWDRLDHIPALGQVFGYIETDTTMLAGADSQPLRAMVVTPNYFNVLGVPASRGRALDVQDQWELRAVLSFNAWTERFAADPAIAGKKIQLGGQPFTVMGVMPRGFHGVTVETSPEVWVPRGGGQFVMPEPMKDPRRCCVFEIAVRLAPGVSISQAQSMVTSAWRGFIEESEKDVQRKEFELERSIQAQSIRNGVSILGTRFSNALRLLLAGVMLLLFMACANVAGLLLSVAAARSRETAVRLAVGASIGRMVRQWIVEALLLGVSAGLLGVALTAVILPQIPRLLPPLRNLDTNRLALALDLQIDVRLLLFAVAAVLLSTMLVAISPVLQIRAGQDLQVVLRASGSNTGGRMWARPVLVALQIALCTLLLISAGVFLRSVDRLNGVATGLDRAHVVTFSVKPGLRRYSQQQVTDLSSRLESGARSLPGVADAAISSRGLMRGSGLKMTIGAAGTRTTRADFLNTSSNVVTPSYFDTMGIRLLNGRLFREQEDPKARVVTKAFAARFFPGQDPIGKRFGLGMNKVIEPEYEIVGVVEDLKYRGLREPIHPQVFGCYCPKVSEGPDFHLQVRSSGDPRSVIQSVTKLMQNLDPQLPFAEVHTLEEEMESSIWQERIVARLASVFAGAAALLAALGLYGMLSFYLAQHMRGVAIRKALGADGRLLVQWIAGRILPMTLAGVMVGGIAALATAQWIQDLLWETSARDGIAYAAALAFIGVLAVAAAWMPGRRALNVDPIKVLRED